MRAITGRTHVAGVIGWPVAHSLSPAIHNAGFESLGVDWTYVAFPTPPGRGASVIQLCRDGIISGLSVTMPHKSDAYMAVDRVSPAAAALHSVNTIVRDPDGALIGHSTDGDGLVDSLLVEGVDPSGREVLVVGWGGAARSVVDALSRRGASRVSVTNRSGVSPTDLEAIAPTGSVVEWADRDGGVASHEIVINCTSVGMGSDGAIPFDVAALDSTATVVDLVYHPLVTPLLRTAAARGCRTIGGLGMLIHQAARQQALWLSTFPDVEAMTQAALRQLAEPPVA